MSLTPRRCFTERVWTSEDIIRYLQKRAWLLHHTPVANEIKKDKEGPKLSVIISAFSSYEDALSAAGLKPRIIWGKQTDEELLDAARKWSIKHGGAKLSEFLLRNCREDLPSSFLIRKRFGTPKAYFELAGVPYEQAKPSDNRIVLPRRT